MCLRCGCSVIVRGCLTRPFCRRALLPPRPRGRQHCGIQASCHAPKAYTFANQVDSLAIFEHVEVDGRGETHDAKKVLGFPRAVVHAPKAVCRCTCPTCHAPCHVGGMSMLQCVEILKRAYASHACCVLNGINGLQFSIPLARSTCTSLFQLQCPRASVTSFGESVNLLACTALSKQADAIYE